MGSFFNAPKNESREERVSKWLKIKEGAPVVFQILDESPTEIHTHWVKDGGGRRLGFKCLGMGHCPICQRNREINFNTDHPDFIRRQRRYRVNVLDLTPVIECPDCDAVYYESTAPARCSTDGCGNDLRDIEPKPLKEVRILEKGKQNMVQLDALDNEEHPLTGEVMRIQEFPIKAIAHGTGLDTVTIFHPQMPRDIDIEEYDTYDLEEETLELTPEEIEFILEGGTYDDIFTARSTEAEVEDDDGEDFDPEDIPY